jgi:hypothetical protein
MTSASIADYALLSTGAPRLWSAAPDRWTGCACRASTRRRCSPGCIDDAAGHFSVRPADPNPDVSRRYLDETLVLGAALAIVAAPAGGGGVCADEAAQPTEGGDDAQLHRAQPKSDQGIGHDDSTQDRGGREPDMRGNRKRGQP